MSPSPATALSMRSFDGFMTVKALAARLLRSSRVFFRMASPVLVAPIEVTKYTVPARSRSSIQLRMSSMKSMRSSGCTSSGRRPLTRRDHSSAKSAMISSRISSFDAKW